MSNTTSTGGCFEANNTTNIELWVVLTTLMLVVKFAIDSLRPWHFSWFMAATANVLEGLNESMVPFIIGVMQLSSTENNFYQVWAVLMVTLQKSVKIGSRRSKPLTLTTLIGSLWTANLLRSKTSELLIGIPLWLIWMLNAAHIIGYFVSSERASRINKENLRLVTDYMSYEHTLSDSVTDANPMTMSSYKYLISGEDKQERKFGAPDFRFRLDGGHEKLITTERIWSLHGDKLLGDATDADSDSRLKDACLSFALYKLLRRRFYNLPMHEAAQEKTRRFIFDGVLNVSNNGAGYERAFRITEVELSFLQDSFYGVHAVMFVDGFPFWRLVLSGLWIAALSFVAYPVSLIRPTDTDPELLRAARRSVLVSYSIIFLIICKEIWEIFAYILSQWTKVWMLRKYIIVPKLQCPLMRKVVRLMSRLIKRGQWNQQVGQFNILIQCNEVKHNFGTMYPTTIKLQPEVKKAIFESFKGLQNTQALGSYFPNAFGSNQVHIEPFSWANEFETDTQRILVWHIATCIFEIELCGEAAAAAIRNTLCLRPCLFAHQSRAASEALWEHYVVALTLSNYCAYLLTRQPQLVPDHNLVSGNVFIAVRHEVLSATSKCRSLQGIHDHLMGKAEESNVISAGTVKMGAELARQLLEMYQENRCAGAWQVLAKFWTGFLLHLAASTKVSRHKEHLQGRGELITHIWALLSHAGLLGSSHDVDGLGFDNDEVY
ncbi:unnamed protein product [Urochloa humidicola]